jgi:hypothetical protein
MSNKARIQVEIRGYGESNMTSEFQGVNKYRHMIEAVYKYRRWLEACVDDKDMQPIQNDTYQECVNKLSEMLDEEGKQ